METVYTIGHSTHPIEVFIEMLQSFGIETLIDIRSIPWSNRFPQFNQELLSKSVEEAWIRYVYLKDLGGRRKVKKDSLNTAWTNASFRWYADYMETASWSDAFEVLKDYARKSVVAYMCSEAVRRRCHRSMVSDALKVQWRNVQHIMGVGKAMEHHYTAPAKVHWWKLSYH